MGWWSKLLCEKINRNCFGYFWLILMARKKKFHSMYSEWYKRCVGAICFAFAFVSFTEYTLKNLIWINLIFTYLLMCVIESLSKRKSLQTWNDFVVYLVETLSLPYFIVYYFNFKCTLTLCSWLKFDCVSVYVIVHNGIRRSATSNGVPNRNSRRERERKTVYVFNWFKEWRK